jgi:hypothetical protein
MSIALRRQGAADAEWVDSWLPAVATALQCELTGRVGGMTRSIITRDGSRIGLIAHRMLSDTAAIIELVATPAALARRGAGMQAAALLEASLRKRGVRTIYAPAPEVHGIAMYFWIRLGYRPLMRGEWPEVREGTVWLRREIAATTRAATRMAASPGSR